MNPVPPIPRSKANEAFETVRLIVTGQVQVVEDVWVGSAEALKILGLTRREQLRWLVDHGHVERRPADKKSFEYNPAELERVKQKLDSKEIILPPVHYLKVA